ncbi:MAG: SIP domain-containing protein [Microbacterium sp.]
MHQAASRNEETRHDAKSCRSSRHARVQHLITADETSLVDLDLMISTLPICSTGRIFIEVPDESWIGRIDAPARMVVTWLDRSCRTGAPGTGRGCAPGQALARAVNAWADEMMCDCDDATRVTLLGGFLGTADIVDHLTGRIGTEADAIHVPDAFASLIR